MKIRNLNTALISIGMILGGLVAGPVHADQPIFSLNQVGSGAQRDQNSRSALSAAETRGPAAYSVDFVPGTEAVAGVNFDVVLEGTGRGASVDVTACESGASTHVARCEMVAPDRLRVLVFSAPAAPMVAAELVRFQLQGRVKGVQIEKSSIAVSDLSGQKLASEVL